jgi:lipopolysaccharide transport system permease protein
MHSSGVIEASQLTQEQEKIDQWTEVIEPHNRLFDLQLKELWRYRDLVMMFVRRDIVANYKQTILGPIWFFLQPILTTLMFAFVFGRVAGLAPKGIPILLFYLAGVTFWGYFSECLTKTATVFKDNAQMFGKVYFPRLAMPVAITISNLVRFLIQFALFLMVWVYFFVKEDTVHPNLYILLTPVLVAMMGLLALGTGMIISALTTKYRDLIFLLTFGIQLLMYATPIIYPLDSPSLSGNIKLLVMANPMSAIVETFRFAFLGTGVFGWAHLGYSMGVILIILMAGAVTFNKVEKNFTDTV